MHTDSISSLRLNEHLLLALSDAPVKSSLSHPEHLSFLAHKYWPVQGRHVGNSVQKCDENLPALNCSVLVKRPKKSGTTEAARPVELILMLWQKSIG